MKKLIRKEDGSITLEAALVLPFFMLFIVFLATIIRIAVADMALYKAASETTEVLVAFAYPVDLATTAAEDFAKEKLQSIIPGEAAEYVSSDDLIQWTDEALQFFGIDVATEVENLFEDLSGEMVLPVLKTKFEEAVGDSFFDSSKLEVPKVELPSLVAGTGEYLQIKVTYEIPISLPFFNESITLSKTASERVWTGS